MLHRPMALMATTSFSIKGRGAAALKEHLAIVEAIAARDGDEAYARAVAHISISYETRLKSDAVRDPESP